MAKLYWSEDRESTYWQGPFETVEACKQDARESYLDLDGAIWIAPIDPETDDDDCFWLRVADLFLDSCEDVNEALAEDGWIDPEDLWLAWPLDVRNADLARTLRDLLGPRPEWRTVDTSKAKRVEL